MSTRQLSRAEAEEEIQREVNRIALGSTHLGYCTNCRRDNVMIFFSNVVNMTSECGDCYHARRLRELNDQIQEEKDRRAEEVRMYFAKRK